MTTSGQAAAETPVTVQMQTSQGVITLELDREAAPITVDNFVTYANDGHYDGTVFHRVISGFMIQGGGFDTSLKQKPTRDPIKLEAGNGLTNARGTIAMARTNAPDSATSQFFINHADNARLDTYGGGYAVFGKVTDGMDVVDAIAALPTGPGGPLRSDVPTPLVEIESVRIIDGQ